MSFEFLGVSLNKLIDFLGRSKLFRLCLLLCILLLLFLCELTKHWNSSDVWNIELCRTLQGVSTIDFLIRTVRFWFIDAVVTHLLITNFVTARPIRHILDVWIWVFSTLDIFRFFFFSYEGQQLLPLPLIDYFLASPLNILNKFLAFLVGHGHHLSDTYTGN